MKGILVIRVEVPDEIDWDHWDPWFVADELIDDADYVVLDAEWAFARRSEVADRDESPSTLSDGERG